MLKNSLGYSRIGKLWYDAKNYPDALSNWQKAKDADPQNPLPYRDLATAYFYVNKNGPRQAKRRAVLCALRQDLR